MKKTKKNQGLSPNQERIMSILEYKKITIIERNEIIDLIKKHMQVKDVGDLISKLLFKERLIPIKKGVYAVIPLSSLDKTTKLSNIEIVDYLLRDNYYIGLFNAYNFHGFTEQIPNKLFIFNTKYSADKKILNYQFKLFKVKKDKLFGILGNQYSDKERTAIDALNYPEYLGGLKQVLDQIRKISFNQKILVDYAIRYNSNKVIKLVGLLTESNKLFKLLEKKKALNYYTTIKKTGTKLLNKKWKLRLI
ncbi:MAG: hypothetical protein KKF50_02350 [Nanoarchaeota archaeon]|nr:hypothetical protein [Nanoarchaeota archaeon]